MTTNKKAELFYSVLLSLILISCTSQKNDSTQSLIEKSPQQVVIAHPEQALLSVKTSSVLPSDKVLTSVHSVPKQCLQKDVDNEVLFKRLQQSYMEHHTLYTGGLHFKTLDSVLGSSLLYFAMNNRRDTFKEITSSFNEGGSYSFYCGWRDCPLKMLGNQKSRYGLQDRYTIKPREVMQSAIRVMENQEKAYDHLNVEKRNYNVHLQQAVFDLDIFTSQGDPVNWWLDSKFPKGFGHLQFAVWEAAKENDLINWLQFTATVSYRNHLQNWAFENNIDKRSDYQELAKYAVERWDTTNSYAWLSALAEVVEPTDPQAQIVVREFNILADKVIGCSASTSERVTFWTMYTNVLRIGSATGIDLTKWLKVEDIHFKAIKNQAVNRTVDYLITALNVDELKKLIYLKAISSHYAGFTRIDLVTAESKEDFLEPEWIKSVAQANADEKLAYLSDNYLRYVSFLDVKELKQLYLELEVLASRATLFKYEHHQERFKKQIRQLISTALLRDWIANDLGNDELLELLARSEPKLIGSINQILKEKSSDIRRFRMLNLILKSPGMTYKLGVPLFRLYDRQAIRSVESLSKIITSNPEDGNWWCSTDLNIVTNRLANDMAHGFGYDGASRWYSGGKWGASFNNAGQKRASLRPDGVIITSYKLHESVVKKFQNQKFIQRKLENKEWQTFALLPSAPVYFSRKLDEISSKVKLDKAQLIELNRSLLTAAHRTCRKDLAVHEIYRKTKEQLNALENK